MRTWAKDPEFSQVKSLSLDSLIEQLQSSTDKVRTENGENDPLVLVPKHKQATYREVIGLIYECSANKVAAQALVRRLLARISALH